jgi:hypothetical protein
VIISDYETMDSIVESDKALSWNGWDVVFDKKTPNGYSHFNGVFKNGEWYIRKTFPITESGWNIPDRMVSRDVQVV